MTEPKVETEEEEIEQEIKEKSVSARLIFTDQQVLQSNCFWTHRWHLTLSKLLFQKKDLRDAFNLLDHTGEGKIKADDFRVAIKALGM